MMMVETVELEARSIDFWLDLSSTYPEEAKARIDRLLEEIEPNIHALTTESDRSSRIHAEYDRFAAASEDSGPLAGVPIGIKDIFQVDGLDTRAGSSLPRAVLSGPEAATVTTLKNAGALVVGKTVTTEFAYFGPGPTRNPVDLDRTPGGSSSGSAAAVAAGLCAVALGTQTIGSISRPASFCGTVGFKPSFDRISTAGVIPLSTSLDHVGLFSTTVRDARTVAALLCQRWSRRDSQRSPRLGIPQGPLMDRATDEARDLFATTIRHLEESGFETIDVDLFSDLDEIVDCHYAIVAAEAARFHRRWFEEYGEHYHPKTRELIQRGAAIEDRDLEDLRSSPGRLREQLTGTMEQHEVDLWLTPAAPGPAPKGLESTGDPILNLPWSHAGLPSLVVPSGVGSSGLPIGLQLAAGWWMDEDLLEWGISMEGIVR